MDDFEQVEHDEDFFAARNKLDTVYLPDNSQSILSRNDSPDVGFNWSVNPYRGCSHGCSYCYARPTHEYLGLNAGLDFESRILVKHDAARLFREFLARPSWIPEVIVFSGVTDCYQPAEREFRLTRQCLEVAWEARQPVGVISKNALVVRDLDIIRQMAELRLIQVNLSITTLDASLARIMEPRTSSPAARLQAIRTLASAGVPVRVMVAPVIPGLNDKEIPAILAAAAAAGAKSASYVILRLPLAVKPVFLEWLARTHPDSKQRIENAIRSVRSGELTTSAFGERLSGTGIIAEQIKSLFRTFAKKCGLDAPLPPVDCELFRPPSSATGQLRLF